jgi:transposase
MVKSRDSTSQGEDIKMNEKEIAELRRRFRPDKSNITHLQGCFVNESREIVSQFSHSLGMMGQEDTELILSTIRRTLSGTLGKNLIDIEFATQQVVDGEEHRLLMALRNTSLNNNEEAVQALFQRIPADHLLKRIEEAVDFGFINDLLADSYCRNNGRPAKEPELMLKLLFLQYLYNLSDVKVLEESNCNLAFLWFLDVNPEDELPDASLLCKFRRYRLKDFSLDEVITEIVRQCVERGLVKGSGVTVDSTHIEAAVSRKVPERIMKHLAKRIFKAMHKDNGSVGKEIDVHIPDYTQIADPMEARQMMKEYLERTIAACESKAGEETKRAIAEAREVLSDEKFLVQKGIRSLADKDARVGRKSRDSSFYGYKMEYMMTVEERIITSVETFSGEYVDGTRFNGLMDRTQESGFMPREVFGDKAYFRAPILARITADGAEPYIPVSASAYHVDETLFSYNKDSDHWCCARGNETVSCKRRDTKRGGEARSYLVYTFDKAVCANCPHRSACMGKARTKARSLHVSLDTATLYALSQRQKTPEFLEKYKKRAAQEWKNGEMKRFHGLARARGFGLRGAAIQAKLTAIAVNLKRIAALMREKDGGTEQLFARLGCLATLFLRFSILPAFYQIRTKNAC